MLTSRTDNLTIVIARAIDAITPLTKELKILGEYQDGKQPNHLKYPTG
jgi:hypothetical protein